MRQGRFLNKVEIKGRVFDYNIEVKKVKNEASENYGKDFINGHIDIATDEKGLNVVQVFYTYVTPTTKQNKPNSTYNALKQIIDTGKSWKNVGKDDAIKVSINSSLALNEWYDNEDNLVSTKRVEGGFCSIIQTLDTPVNKFTLDVIITNARHIEATEENHLAEDYTQLRCLAFDWRNAILPCNLAIKLPDGMKYFENEEITEKRPMLTQLRGEIISRTEITTTAIEGAFAGDAVDTSERRVREWEVNWARKVPYDFGDPKEITEDEYMKAIQDRRVYLADVKARQEEYQASKKVKAIAPIAKIEDGFDFAGI